MALPVLLQKLFGNSGVGPKLRPDIIPTTVNNVSADASGNIAITNIDTASSAGKLTTARTLSITGDGSGSGSFDGSKDLAIGLTLTNSGVTAGSYGTSANASPTYSGSFTVPYVTVDAKGRVTGIKNVTITLPADNSTATSSALGLVKIGSNITVSDGVISVSKTNVTSALGYTPLQAAPVTSVDGKTGAVSLSGVYQAKGSYLSTSGGTVSGNLTVTGTLKGATIQSTSDSRLKADITPYTADLSSISAYRYTLNADGMTHIGLIAQEVKAAIPEAVSTDSDGFYCLDYNAIVAVLVDKVNELEKRLNKASEN